MDPSYGREFNVIPLEAVEIINGTLYGLFSGLWTNDGSYQLRLGQSFELGQKFMNNHGAGEDVTLSFCGDKLDGHCPEKGFEVLYRISVTITVPSSMDKNETQ